MSSTPEKSDPGSNTREQATEAVAPPEKLPASCPWIALRGFDMFWIIGERNSSAPWSRFSVFPGVPEWLAYHLDHL